MEGQLNPVVDASVGRSHEARHVWEQLRILFDGNGELVGHVGSSGQSYLFIQQTCTEQLSWARPADVLGAGKLGMQGQIMRC